MSVNLPVVEVPQLVFRLDKVHQLDGGVILRASQLSSSAITVKLDSDHAMSTKTIDKKNA